MQKKRLFFLFPFFLILYEFCTNMSNDMYLPALPIIAQDFAIPLNYVQFTLAAWLAGDASVQLIIGPLADRYGRRPILLGGGLIFLLSTFACGAASSILFLIIARFFQGVGVCCMMVAGYASVHDLYKDRKAIHILAWMGSAAVLAPAIGPLFGGLLLLVENWQMIFYTLFIAGIVAISGLWFTMPETTAQSRHSLNVKKLIGVYRTIFSTPRFMISAASFGLLYGGIIAWITDSPFVLMQVLDISPTQFGWIQLLVFGSYIIGALVIKTFIKRISAETIISLGLSISLCATIFLMFFSISRPNSALSFILPMIGYCIGFGMASAPLNRITINAITTQRGAAISVFYLTMTGCGTLISFILSIIPDSILTTCSAITLSIFLSYILNNIRQRSL